MMTKYKYYPWVVVALLWVVALLNYLDRQMLSTMRDAIKVDIVELQKAEKFGALMAIFLYVYAFMSPIAGSIADKFSRKKLIVGSLFVWSLVTFLMGYVHDFQQLYWLRGLMGVSEALYIPAGISLIADYHSDKSRSLAIGIHMTGLYIGSALGGFGAVMALTFSWQGTFHYLGLLGILYAFVLSIFLHDKKVDNKDSRHAIVLPLKQGLILLGSNIYFWVIVFYFAVPSIPGWATKNWLPTLFQDSLHLSMSQAGPLSTITITSASFLGVLFGGILSDKWVQKNIRGRIYTSAIGLFLTIPALILLGFSQTAVGLVAAGFSFGFGFGMFDANNMPILCQFVPQHLRATAYGIMNLGGILSGAFITNYMGKFSDQGSLGIIFASLSIIVFIAIILQLSVLKPPPFVSVNEKAP